AHALDDVLLVVPFVEIRLLGRLGIHQRDEHSPAGKRHLDSPAACRSGRAHGSRGGRHPEVVERSAEPRRTVAHLTVRAREPEPMDTVLSVYTVNMGPGSRFPGSRGSLVGTTPPGVLRRLDPAGLPAEHGALAGEPPVIAAQVAALADHAVTRHHERDR